MNQRKSAANRPATPPHLIARLKKLRTRAKEHDWGIDALLINNPRDIRYLTGFIGDDSWAVVPIRSSAVTVISDSRFDEQIRRDAPHVTVMMRKGSVSDEIKNWMEHRGIEKLGLQEGHITLSQRRALAKKLGAKRLVAIDDGLIQQRSVKNEHEIKAIRRALKIQQEAYQRTLAWIEPGQSENEVAAYLEYQMRSLGADGPSFPTIIAADANASLPHAVPGSRKVRPRGSVLIDWGARWNGYCSDLTRVIAIGKMKPKVREIYIIVRDAQQAAIETIAPGVPAKQVDTAARQLIDKAGYGSHFGHSLGHGLGLDVHEQPTLSSRSHGVLEPGQVVTVEPGIYLPGVGGVRIEDDVLVTARGRRVLSRLPSDLESAII